jgi:hypothetical protein
MFSKSRCPSGVLGLQLLKPKPEQRRKRRRRLQADAADCRTSLDQVPQCLYCLCLYDPLRNVDPEHPDHLVDFTQPYSTLLNLTQHYSTLLNITQPHLVDTKQLSGVKKRPEPPTIHKASRLLGDNKRTQQDTVG